MLKYLLEKEFKQITRNKFLPRMIVMLPLMVLLLFPLAANYEIKNINLSIVDNDRSPFSHKLAEKIGASGYFRITQVTGIYSEALGSIENGKSDLILEIPSGFEKALMNESKTNVMISADTVDATKGGLGSSYLNGIVTDFNNEIRQGTIAGQSVIKPGTIDIVSQYKYNPHLRYTIFMVPALMVMILTQICGFLPALNIVGEKEKGTIEQMNVTPVKKMTFIFAKLIPYWAIGFVVLTICFVIAFITYGIIPKGNILTIYVFAAVFILSLSGLGLVISNYASTVQQATFMMFFFITSLIFLSGLYTPVESMPGWAQMVSNFSPLKYFIKVMRLVYLKGSGVTELIHSFLSLCGFAVFFNGWAVLSYKKSS